MLKHSLNIIAFGLLFWLAAVAVDTPVVEAQTAADTHVSDIIRQQNWADPSADTSVTATYLATPTSGNMLVALWRGNDVTDNITGPTGWTLAVEEEGADFSAQIYYKRSEGTESTVTVTGSSAVSMGLHVFEVEGVLAEGELLDQTSTDLTTGANVTTQSTGTTATTAQTDEIAIAMVGMRNNDGELFSWTNDFERLYDLEVNRLGSAARVLDSTQTVETTATWESGSRVVALLATFKLAAAPTPSDVTYERVAHGSISDAENSTGETDTGQEFAITADRLYLVYIGASIGGGTTWPVSISDSHNGTMTWTLVGHHGLSESSARRVHIFRALAPSSEAADSLVINTADPGVAMWHLVVEVSGMDTGGTNGADAIAQTATRDSGDEDPEDGMSTEVNLAFDDAPASTSAVTGIILIGHTEKHVYDTDPDAHMLVAEGTPGGDSKETSVQWFNGSDQTVTWSWDTETHGIAMGVEVAEAEEEPSGGGDSGSSSSSSSNSDLIETAERNMKPMIVLVYAAATILLPFSMIGIGVRQAVNGQAVVGTPGLLVIGGGVALLFMIIGFGIVVDVAGN